MNTTCNGWPVLEPGSPLLHTWDLAADGAPRITFRNGSVGFLLAVHALFIHEKVERLDINPTVHDDGGYAHRPITGGSCWSEHAGGCAEDLNWTRHPYNTPTLRTWTPRQVRMIRRRITWVNVLAGGKVLEWGGDWPSHPGSTAKTDSMHTQVNPPMERAERAAKRLARFGRGRRILKANPGQREVIWS